MILIKYLKDISFFVFCFFIIGALSAQENTDFKTEYFSLFVNKKGYISHLTNRKTSSEYLPSGESSPLLSLFKKANYIYPVSFNYSKREKKISLKFSNGSVATIRVSITGLYLRFELLSLEPRDGVEAIVWGPYATTINEKIGETICVVRNQNYAIGLQALNINTIEGLPNGDDNAGGGGIIDPLPGQQLPDSLKNRIGDTVDVNVNVTGDLPEYVRLYRGSAAIKKVYGSELRLFSRDRRIPRVINDWKGKYKQYVEPINVDFEGSAIAMFGCPSDKTLDVIEQIEINEGLPHPMLNGVWVKKSKIPGEAYLLNEGDPAKSLHYAEACGFQLVHIGDIFQSWGHFGLNTKKFPNGAQDIRRYTDLAHKEGISLGVHTLTMFTTKNDSYITPAPSDSLCKNGSSVVVQNIGQEDDIIYIKDPEYFKLLGNTRTVKIGKELINYRKVSEEKPWRLLDCQRGQYGTSKSFHKAGTVIDKLTNNDYSGFYPDINLQDAYAKRLAQVCNETGIDLMDFDGFGGESPTGHGSYGAARFIDLWYKNLNRYRITCGAGTFHYYWHIYSFMNWGEPWYNALRESQVNYRIENQCYFDRNLMPGMLGWFTLNPNYRPEEVEWIQARSAAFNAGYLLRIDEGIEKNGFKNQLFELIREWQKARKSDVFSQEQKERMKNPHNEFHLEKKTDTSWALFPVRLSRGFEHKYREVQTGEPHVSKFSVQNPYKEQPLQFYISVLPVDDDLSATNSEIQFMVNNFQTLVLNVSLKAGDRVYCDGQKVYLCDKTWNKLKVISTDSVPVVENGSNEIQISSDMNKSTSPKLEIEFKSVGKPEFVTENRNKIN